jgi:hypothetical protein
MPATSTASAVIRIRSAVSQAPERKLSIHPAIAESLYQHGLKGGLGHQQP